MSVRAGTGSAARRRGLTIALVAVGLLSMAASIAGAAERMVLAEYFTSVF